MYSCDLCKRDGLDIGMLYPVDDGVTISYDNGKLCYSCHEKETELEKNNN
jgi:hypothetical protein